MLGHGDTQDRPQLKVVEALRGKKVLQITARANRSMAVLATDIMASSSAMATHVNS